MKQKFVFYEHTERASLRNQAFRRYRSSKGETDFARGGGGERGGYSYNIVVTK